VLVGLNTLSETRSTPITIGEADLTIFALRKQADAAEELADRLILGTNSQQAGFNQIDTAREMRALADRLEAIFPPDPDEVE